MDTALNDEPGRTDCSPSNSLSASLSSHESMSEEERIRRLKELFQDIKPKENLQKSLTEAIACLQSILPPIEPTTELVEDPNNEVAVGPTEPYLIPNPHWPGLFVPQFSDSPATKRNFARQWLILPSKLCNVTHNAQTLPLLLSSLNTIFETNFKMTPGVEAMLTDFVDDGCDLGMIYGYLRPWIYGAQDEDQFSRLTDLLRGRREEDFALRSAAMNSNHITNPRLPPRRVWDLYSNRVLPYHVLPTKGKRRPRMPLNLWAVSHAWVTPSARQSVLTTINGKAWRVPIPCGTTLDDIRNELLVLGAEYVFLDVLCLRQKDELLPDFESARKREWRLDIPTIGYVYNENTDRPVIIYFNGLGLPFRDSLPDPGDRFDWFNRVWTLQETPCFAIIGGLGGDSGRIDISFTGTNTPSGVSTAFVSYLRQTRAIYFGFDKVLHAITTRAHANPVDQVACLAYLLDCETLPIYDADIGVEVAWGLLLECLPDESRTQLLFAEYVPRRGHSSSRPTWAQLTGKATFRWFGVLDTNEQLKHLDVSSPELGYRFGLDAYYHRPYVVIGCHFDIINPGGEDVHASLKVPCSKNQTQFQTFKVSEWGEPIEPNVEYMLIGVGRLETWIVARAEGVRRIGTQRAVEVSKVSTIVLSDSDFANGEAVESFKRKLGGSNKLVVYR